MREYRAFEEKLNEVLQKKRNMEREEFKVGEFTIVTGEVEDPCNGELIYGISGMLLLSSYCFGIFNAWERFDDTGFDYEVSPDYPVNDELKDIVGACISRYNLECREE